MTPAIGAVTLVLLGRTNGGLRGRGTAFRTANERCRRAHVDDREGPDAAVHDRGRRHTRPAAGPQLGGGPVRPGVSPRPPPAATGRLQPVLARSAALGDRSP